MNIRHLTDELDDALCDSPQKPIIIPSRNRAAFGLSQMLKPITLNLWGDLICVMQQQLCL